MVSQNFESSVAGNYAVGAMPSLSAKGVIILERPDHYELITDLKGAAEEDVLVGILDHVLTVGSKTASEVCGDIGKFLVVDHQERSIERSFALPADADEDDVCVIFADGKLKIVIGRKPSGAGTAAPLSAMAQEP